MSIQEKIQEHVKEKCKYCLKEDCDGIHINTNNEATCEREREEQSMIQCLINNKICSNTNKRCKNCVFDECKEVINMNEEE